VLSAVTPLLVMARAPAPIRGPAPLLFLCLVPGGAVAAVIRLRNPVAEIALVVGFSLAVGTLVAQAILSLHLWHPDIATDVIAILTLATLARVSHRGPRRGEPVGGQAGAGIDPDGETRRTEDVGAALGLPVRRALFAVLMLALVFFARVAQHTRAPRPATRRTRAPQGRPPQVSAALRDAAASVVRSTTVRTWIADSSLHVHGALLGCVLSL
jgi:hypothetical protein